ncbi:hypothetical protein [Acetobacter indonesiensis]|uniref:Uncharacterized protein n=2 Tax=Acetobacter indonesiensis TaxID=104101 RepID=A0A252AH14_9PROT|nr:hypothetical protein [Acetobacter indonesiensis]OUI88909.1 hypothetical protein HK17_16070 [Acetobacter indonesiensis]
MSDKYDILENGEIIGWYYVKKGMITVTSKKNYQSQTTQASRSGSNEALARIMLSEPWAI